MNLALWIAKTGLDAQQTDIAVISNNLANAATVGYKKSRAVFEDLLYQTASARWAIDPKYTVAKWIDAGHWRSSRGYAEILYPRQLECDQ